MLLFVDDDVDILTLVQLKLAMNGFNVEAVSRWQNIDNSIVNFNPA